MGFYPPVPIPTTPLPGSDDTSYATTEWVKDLVAGQVYDVKAQYRAVAEGPSSHPLSLDFDTLAEAQAVYPAAVDLDDETDWAAIQSAFNAMMNSGFGGTILLNPGVYVINKLLSITNGFDFRIIGYGASIFSRADQPLSTLQGRSLQLTTCTSVVLEGFVINGNASERGHGTEPYTGMTGTTLVIEACHNFYLKNIVILDPCLDGIYISGTGDLSVNSQFSKNGTIENCDITGHRNAISVISCWRLSIRDNFIHDVQGLYGNTSYGPGAGVDVESNATGINGQNKWITFYKNRFENCLGTGVLIQNIKAPADMIIDGNSFENCSCGVNASCDRLTIVNNFFANATYNTDANNHTGESVYQVGAGTISAATSVIIANNTFTGITNMGTINVGNFTIGGGTQIIGNHVETSTYNITEGRKHVIECSANDAVIAFNSTDDCRGTLSGVLDNAMCGIKSSGTGCLILGNTIRRHVGVGISVPSGADKTRVIGNRMKEFTGNGTPSDSNANASVLLIAASDCTIANNTIENFTLSAGGGLGVLTVTGSRAQVIDNKLNDVTKFPILTATGTGGYYRGNIVTQTSGTGKSGMSFGGGNVIEGNTYRCIADGSGLTALSWTSATDRVISAYRFGCSGADGIYYPDGRFSGVATLVGGTVTVSTTAVTATTRIRLTRQATGGTMGDLYIASRVNGTSFTITSSSGTDTSTVLWELIEREAS